MKQNRAGGLGRRWAWVAIAIGAGGLFAGCGSNPFSLSQEAVAEHRAHWESVGPADYEYVYRRSCECGPETTEPALVEVRSGLVESVTINSSGATPSSGHAYPTVDGLFDLIEEAIDRGAAGLMVSYDGALGYPTEISIDYDLQVVDDEVTIQASDLLGR